jgi:hypothetical protein
MEVYTGYSLKEFSKVREILSQQRIPYTYKVIDQSQKWTGQGTIRADFGSFGVNMNYEKQYTVSVKKDEYERAQFLIDKEMHS